MDGRRRRAHNADAPPRVVVSQSLAERWFAGEHAIGRQIRLGPGPRAPVADIIGVAGNVKHRALDEEGAWPTVYRPVLQTPSGSMLLVVRSQRPDADVIAAVQEEKARLDGDLATSRVRSMQQMVAASAGVPARRVLTATFMGFALLAIVLAGIGLFGVVAHDVASRRAELALRLALGADPMRILMRTLVRRGLGARSVVERLSSGRPRARQHVSRRVVDPLTSRSAPSIFLVRGVCRRRRARRAPPCECPAIV